MPAVLTPEAEAPFSESVRVDDFATMTPEEIEASYRAMAADQEREAEALEWSEGTFGALTDEA